MNEMNESCYYVAYCPICHQGWLEVVKDVSSGELIITCQECESEWDHPEKINDPAQATLDRFGRTMPARYEGIVNKGWDSYLIEGPS